MVMIQRRGTTPAPAPAQVRRNVELDDLYQQLRGELLIDRNNLHKAAERQADLFFQVAEKHTMAISIRDAAKEMLEKTDAHLAAVFRQADPKATVGAIKDQVILDAGHQRDISAVLETNRRVMDWGILRDSYEQRHRMIKELVSMYATGYWTNQSMGGTQDKARQAQADQARERLADERRARNNAGSQ